MKVVLTPLGEATRVQFIFGVEMVRWGMHDRGC